MPQEGRTFTQGELHMQVTREKVYETGHPMGPDDHGWGEDECVVVKLINQERYSDKVLVEIQTEQGNNKYEFDVLPDQHRRLRYKDGESVPLGIRHYLADFGYYLEHSTDGPWGQYEYLIDAAGRFEARAEQSNSPVTNFFFRLLSRRFQRVVVDAASETAVLKEEYTQEQLAEAVGMSDIDEFRLVHAIIEIKKLPLSEKIVIPERFKRMGVKTEIVLEDTDNDREPYLDILTAYDEQQDTTAVIVVLTYADKYFKLNGAPGGECSLEFTDRGELPGPFIEDYLKKEAGIKITNTPRIDPSASNLELLSQGRSLLDNIQVTDGICIPSDESTVEITQIMIDTIELFLRIQQAVGAERFLNLADTVFAEKTDGVTVDDLTEAPLNQYDTVVFLLGLTNQRLGDKEREQIEIEMERKGLDEIDTNSMSLDGLTEYINEQMTALEENW